MQQGSALSPEERLELETRVLEQVRATELASLTSSLVKIPSVNPPGGEKPVAEFIVSWFENRGFECTLIEATKDRPNVEVKLDDGNQSVNGKSLIFNGHMDVVPTGSDWTRDPFGGQIDSGRIYGRGSADMKGGLACMMTVMETLKSSGVFRSLHGSLIFNAVVDEEVGGPFGTSHMVRARGLRGDFAVIGEPTDISVCSAHKGNITFDVTTRGKSAHASVPHEGVNAILKMNEIISGLNEYSSNLRKGRTPHPLLGHPTLNVGMINGGTKSNVVPDRCVISAERRVVSPESLEGAKSELESLLASLKQKDPCLEYELQVKVLVGPSELRDGREGLGALISSFEEVAGKHEVHPVGFVATCDAYFLTTFGEPRPSFSDQGASGTSTGRTNM